MIDHNTKRIGHNEQFLLYFQTCKRDPVHSHLNDCSMPLLSIKLQTDRNQTSPSPLPGLFQKVTSLTSET